MVISNPYLKKKPAPMRSTNSGGGRCPLSVNSSIRDNNARPDSDNRRHLECTNSGFAYAENTSQSHPSRISPIGKEVMIKNVGGKKVVSKNYVSPPSITKQRQKTLDNSVNTQKYMRSSKSKMSVKRRLKQEIAALKRQKQLQKLRRETEERKRCHLERKKEEENRRIALRAAKEEERRKKQAERERSAAMKKEEKIRKQRERERKQQEKEQEREQKRIEKNLKEQEKQTRLKQEIEEQKQKEKLLEEIYRKDLQAWKDHQQRWIEQQQRINIMQRAQQQAQFNYHLIQQTQIRSGENRQYVQHHERLQTKVPSTSTSLLFPRCLSHSSAEIVKHQNLNKKHERNQRDAISEARHQQKIAHPISSSHFNPAASIDTSMNLKLISSSQQETANGDGRSEIQSILVGSADSRMSSEDGCNANSKNCKSNEDTLVSTACSYSSRTPNGQNSFNFDKSCDQTSIDKKGKHVSKYLARNDIAEVPTQSDKSGSDDSILSPNTHSIEVASKMTIPLCMKRDRTSQLPIKDLDLRPHLVQPSLEFPIREKELQQHFQPGSYSAVNHKYSLHSNMHYGSLFPWSCMATQTLTNAPYWNSSPSVDFPMIGHFSWVPPPPPPPLPPIFRRPKLSRRRASVSRRTSMSQSKSPSLLCNPLEVPSPFASQGRHLVTVTLIRDPRTEQSFGVNLKLHTESALVDPRWLEAQKHKERRNLNTNEQSDKSANTWTKNLSTLPPTCVSPSTALSSSSLAQGKEITTTYQSPKSLSKEKLKIYPTDDFSKEKSDGDEQESKESARNVTVNKGTNHASILTSKTDLGSHNRIKHSNSQNSEEIIKSCLDDLVSSVLSRHNMTENQQQADSTTNLPIIQKRRRRRRIIFSVMQVVDANKQNTRRPNIDLELMLRPGDIVVSVQGNSFNGLTFQDACGLFTKKAECVNDSLIQIEVTVARKKAAVVPAKLTSAENINSKPRNSAVDQSMTCTSEVTPPPQENTSMVFSPAEIATLSNCVFRTLHDSNRILGLHIEDDAWHFYSTIFRMGPLLKNTEVTSRKPITLKNKWCYLSKVMDYNLVEQGKKFWERRFRKEFGDQSVPFSSDAERNIMRQLPRPSKGCRCKRKDHEYVFDPKCTLYHDLQRRLSEDELSRLRQQKKINCVSNRDLSVVESAFKNRMLKLKTATENESIEARFVQKMEEIQVKELRQAIFAPNLSTIVLSTIFEIQRDFCVPIDEGDVDTNGNIEEDNDGDDDVPLECLGKRKAYFRNEDSAKKQQNINRKEYPKISTQYLVRVLLHVSKTWGHCYREPERNEYVWRWELFHAIYSDYDQWDKHATNPREPGSLPFENVRFGLNGMESMKNELFSLPGKIRDFEDSVISKSKSSFEISNEVLDQFCLISYLLSPTRTGLYDEMLALSKMGVLKVSPGGIPVLTDDWWTQIDVIMLDEMISSWSTKADPDSKYCVNDELRDTLENKWVKSDYGWSLQDDPKELVFDFTVLDEWRETFEGREEEKASISEGIGKFGL